MKYSLLILFFPLIGFSQKIQKYHDAMGKVTDAKNARFYFEAENRNDSGWHASEYYLLGPSKPSIKTDGWFTDSTFKTGSGQFYYFYPNKNVQRTGSYVSGKKEGVWLEFYFNGLLSDSGSFQKNKPVGLKIGWYSNGYISDSAVYEPDGSAIEMGWFDNGRPSYSGRLVADYKRQGKWQFFHKSGAVSAIESYDNGKLIGKKYFDEKGTEMDTTTNDKHASPKGGKEGWRKYLGKSVYYPRGVKIVNAEKVSVVVTATVNEEGDIEDAYVSVPFARDFDDIALKAIKNSPKWDPEIKHNRAVKSTIRQTVTFAGERPNY